MILDVGKGGIGYFWDIMPCSLVGKWIINILVEPAVSVFRIVEEPDGDKWNMI
jgi:hypothetical protein